MNVEAILERLDKPHANPLDLLRVYRSDDDARAFWKEDPRLHRAFARGLIGAGHHTRAFELVREGLEAHPKDQELSYLGALALSRGGNPQRAGEYVTTLLSRPDIRPETRREALSLAGNIEKKRYIRSTRAGPDLAIALRSADLYSQAYAIARDEVQTPDRDKELFPGVNAATMAFMADDSARAREMAAAVLARANDERARPEKARDYWLPAIIGEVMLMSGNLPEAAEWYSRAVDMARDQGKDGDIMAMHHNFQLLRAKIPLNEEIWGFFNIGNVVAFAGHMVDHPARPTGIELPSRFPSDPGLIRRVEEEIEGELESLNARVGYCSAACGSDILFAERILERKAELHVVLPFDREDFYATSVDYGLPADVDGSWNWRSRCDRVLDMATEVHHATTEKYLGDDVLFAFANTLIQGLAIIRADARGVAPFALVVLDRQNRPGGVPGGTADFLDRWTGRQLEAREINLAALRDEVGALPARPITAKPPGPSAARVRRKTMVMLFADVKNFSKLDDVRFPDFFATFLDEVKHVIDEMTPPPAFVNTWGDGLYIVFERVVAGAEFALRLVDRVKQVDWARLGLPVDTTVRIGIHAGPVYQRMDPIIGRENVFGSQVNRAARIEPVTTPGCAFASEQFAAALAAEANHPFTCEYVGIEELAKGYDKCPLYLLGRR